MKDLGDDNPPLELLARHLQEGNRPDESALYWRRAGERALGRFAHVEAIADFKRALAAIEAGPDTGERSRFELETQTLLGPSLMYVMGQGAAEVERTYERALELADRLDDSQASFTAAWGLWRLQFARADMRAALRLASKCGQAVAASNDRVIRLGTAFALGATHLFSGDCSAAAPHLERSIGLYRAMPDKSVLAVFGQDPGLSSLAYLGWVRWTLGLPEQALVLSEEAVQLARDIGKPVLIAIATGFAGMTHSMRGDIPRLTECAEECLSICERHRFRQHAAMSNVMLAYAYSRRGDFARASAMAEQALDEKVALHSYIALPWFCYLAAEVYLAANRLDKALEATRKGIEFAARGGERFFESENHRMHARIVAEDPKASRRVAAGNFDRALRQAREQQAKSLELRAACSFARFAAAHGDADRARELLAPIYDSFTEGFETADLKEAADLLRELS